jgi:uncharacterized protein (DUF885 family)
MYEFTVLLLFVHEQVPATQWQLCLGESLKQLGNLKQ